MKTIETLGAQGDVLFVRVKSLPKDATPAEGLVVAHSETGHHHRARITPGYECERYTTPNPLVSYLRIREAGESIKARADKATAAIDAVLIEHERQFDTHETLALGPGTWRVIRQRELTPKGWRAVVD